MSQITSRREGSIQILSFNRPEKMNALTREMYAGLANGLNEAAGDFAVRAVVLSSEGDHFTAGNDIADFLANPPTNEDSDVARFLGSLLEFPKPLIAAVKGNAVGVGTTMLLHCDVVVAGPSAKFSMPFASLGLVPEAGSSYLFPLLVGYQRAAKIFMTGESFDADSAKEMGLVASIASDPLREAMEIATHISEQPPQAMINTKVLLKASKHDAVAAVMKAEFELFSLALQSEEAMEAFMNFMARDGASVAIAAKTSEPNPKLPGTIHSAAQEIRDAGGIALPIQCDLRDEEQIAAAVNQAAQEFGGIDILINNASAINLTPTEATPAKRFDLMFDVNVRGTFLTSQAAIPHLRESAKAGRNPHFRRTGIAINALWPRTAIDTAALQMIPGVDTAACRTPEILADAAYVILNRESKDCTGNFFVDDEVLASVGITDLEKYSVVPGTTDFLLDFFLD